MSALFDDIQACAALPRPRVVRVRLRWLLIPMAIVAVGQLLHDEADRG